MADLDITGRVVFDASQAESALDKVGDKAEQMAREVAGAAGQAGKAVDGMGDGAGASAEKFTRAEARIRDSIKRSTQELNLLGKTASEKLEFKIADKGLDSSKFTSYIAELRKAEAAQMALGAASVRSGSVATASLNSMGMSAAATANALRGVPAQFTDIVTSLQGGQAPLTVFLQQGGQLKDMFGGAGNAARALGGYVIGLVNPFTLAAAAVGVLGLAYFQGSKEADAYNKALITTGNASGSTAAQMQQMAQRISSVVGTQSAAAATLAQLAGSSRIAAENFEYFGTVALKVEKTVGTAVAETVKQFAELGKSPVEASKKLNEETNYLTQAIYEQIKALKDQGREAEAAATAQKAYADAINSRSDQMTQNLGLIERAWRGITGAAKGAWDAMLNVGRQDTLQDQIGAIRTRLDAARSERGMTGSFGQTGIDKGIEVLQQRLSLLTEQERLLKRGAESQAARAQAEKSAIEATDALGKANEKAFTKQEQMNKALGEYRANLEKVKAVNPNSALLDPAQVEKSEKAIRAQFTERTAAVRKGNDELQKQQDLIAKLSGLDPSFSREWEQLSKAYAAGKINLSQLVDLQAQLLAKQPAITAATKAQAEAEKERAKTAEELVKTMEAYAKANQDGVAQSIQAATQAEAQLAQYGLLKSEVQGLTLAYLEQSRESAALAGEDVSNIDKRITAQKRLIAATSGIEQRDAAKKAAQDAESEWQRTADSINNSLTDALLRAFESGKDFAQALKTTVINMFKTLVLRPVISAVVNPIAGALTGGLGLSGAAQAASGLGSAGSALSGLGSLGGLFGAGLKSGLSGLIGEAGLSGVVSAGTTAIGAGNIAGGLGTLAGPLAILGGGILALTSILKATKGETRTGGQFGVAFDGAVTNNRRDQTYTIAGQQFDRDFTNGLQTALRDGLTYRLEGDPVAQEGAIKAAVSGTASGINGILKALGSEARLAGFSAGLETSGKGRGGVFAGGTFADGRTFGESGKGDNYQGTLYEKFSSNSPDFKAALENFTLDLKQSTIQALQSVADIPKSVKSLLDGVDAEGLADDAANALLEAINTQIVGVEALKASFSSLGMDKLADLSFDAAAGLAAASGGFEKLQSNLATYYDNFYSEEEKRANVVRQIAESLKSAGIEISQADIGRATREQFRSFYEAVVDANGVADPAAVAILNVAGAFAAITPAADKAAAAVAASQRAAEQAAEEAARRAEEVARERAGLQRNLLTELGDTNALRRLELDALDASNRALQERIYALQDAKAAEEAAKGAINTAYSALERAVSAEKEAINKQLQAQQDGYQAQIDAAQEAANTIKSIASALASAVKSTQIDSDAFSFQRLQNARSTIGGAASTGNLQYAGLEDALGVAGQDSKKFYGRFEDYAFDQGVLAGNVGKLNDQAQGQLTTAEKTLQALKDQMRVSGDQARAEIAKLDEQLLTQRAIVDAVLGLNTAVVSVGQATAGLQGAIAGLAAAQAASAIAKAQGSSAVGGGGTGGMGGGTSYEGATYTDFMGNQVALQAGQSRQFLDAVAAAGTSAVSSLSELRDRLQAVGKSDIWEALSKDLTLNYQDFDQTGGRGVPTISASDGVVSVAGYRPDNQSVQDYAANISAWAQANGVQGATNNGYTQSDISNAINTTLGQGASISDIINAGAANFGLTEQEIREAARAAGIPGFASGGYHAGGLRIVGENGPELEATGASRIWNATDTQRMMSGGNGDMVAELRALRAEVAELKSTNAAIAGHTAATHRQLVRIAPNDIVQTEVAA